MSWWNEQHRCADCGELNSPYDLREVGETRYLCRECVEDLPLEYDGGTGERWELPTMAFRINQRRQEQWKGANR